MKKILIIEDNKLLSEDVCDILVLEGYEAIISSTGKMGIELAIKHIPDLILCDIMMPEMDGFEVLSELKQHEQTKLIPFIFITSLADRANFRNGMEMGADDYITKPFTIKELMNAIHVRLEKYYNFQIGNAIENIEKNLSIKYKNLKKQIKIQLDLISEISENNSKLTDKLKEKETELFEEVVKAVEISNALLTFRNQVENELTHRSVDDPSKELLQTLLKKIERIGIRKDNWRIFQLKFNQVYPDFIARITREFPKLTQMELTIISTVLFNLNSNQVAGILNISTESVRKSRYRLKKKLKLKSEDSLVKYIHGFHLNR
jgi:DNA-binding response OmpR family regulator/DNA-binding CsgD family transcriptional regulator